MDNNAQKRKISKSKSDDFGNYLITICTNSHLNTLGEISKDNDVELDLTYLGKTVRGYINQIPHKYRAVKIDKYVIMPNHIHILLKLSPTQEPFSINKMVSWFKHGITAHISETFPRQKIFENSFIKNELKNNKRYILVRNYIENNIKNWKDDCFYTV
ncbi:MAG: transposase [Clostridia bacterium]|nr:transposase [Clostridia bacterium]